MLDFFLYSKNLILKFKNRSKISTNYYFFILALFCVLLILTINKIKDSSIAAQIIWVGFVFLIIIFSMFYLVKSNKWSFEQKENLNLISLMLFLIITMIVLIRTVCAILIPYSHAGFLYGKDETITGVITTFISTDGKGAFFSNELLDFSYQQEQSLVKADMKSIILDTKYGLISIYCNIKNLEYGDLIKVNLHLTQPSPQRNPGGFDEKFYYQSNGIYLKGSLINGLEPVVIKKIPNLFFKMAYATRSFIMKVYIQNLPSRESGLMIGLLLGDRSMMSSEDILCYQKAGLSHITAVSGSAITFLLIPMQTLLKKIKVGKMRKSIFIFLVLLFFGFITGWTPSISRALLMVFILMIARAAHKKMTAMQSLFITFALLLAITPFFALNIGFWLSSAATAGIIQLSGPIENILKKRFSLSPFIGSTISTCLAAGISVMPFAIWVSKEISVSSILSGVLVLPIVEFTTVFGSIEALAGIFGVNNILTNIFAVPLKGLLFSIYKIALNISKIEILHISTRKFSFFILFAISLFVIFLFITDKKNKRKCLFLTMCILFTGIIHTFVIISMEPEMQIIFADVGQGDATLIILKTGETILIDAGTDIKGTPVINKMLDYYSIKHPTIYIATHTHSDHCGGMIPIISQRGGDSLLLPYGTLERVNEAIANRKIGENGENPPVVTDSYTEPDFGESLVATAKSKNIEITEVGAGNTVKINDSLVLTIYNPEKTNNLSGNQDENIISQDSGGNQASMIIRLEFKNHKILIMGDATVDVEKKLVESGQNISSNIYRISHHGSPSSTNNDIINAVSPKISIISVGKNFYGHPSPKVIKRLEDSNSEVLRTDEDGAIIIDISNNKLQVNKMIQFPVIK